MDRFDTMRLFVRIVERRSFTLAASDLDLPRSTVTQAIKRARAGLGQPDRHRSGQSRGIRWRELEQRQPDEPHHRPSERGGSR